MSSKLKNVLSRPSPFNKMNMMLRWNSSIRSIPEFQVMYSERLSNCSSAPTSFRTTTFPLAMSVIVRELPHTNMLALIMPLPEISRFSMPPPFGQQHNYTWALCHGTTIKTAQLILLEGKIRPANWSYHKSATYPPLGHFTLAEKSPMRTKQSRPGQKRPSLIPWRKKAKANRMSPWAQSIEEPMSTSLSELVATKKPKLAWATKA